MPSATVNRGKPRSKTHKTSVLDYQVSTITLLGIALDLDFEDDDELELFHGIGVGHPEKTAKNKYAFRACARAGKYSKGGTEASTIVQAVYGVLISTEVNKKNDLLRLAKHCAQNVLWGRYTVWFSATVAQIPVSLPPLPFVPADVEYDEDLDPPTGDEKRRASTDENLADRPPKPTRRSD